MRLDLHHPLARRDQFAAQGFKRPVLLVLQNDQIVLRGSELGERRFAFSRRLLKVAGQHVDPLTGRVGLASRACKRSLRLLRLSLALLFKRVEPRSRERTFLFSLAPQIDDKGLALCKRGARIGKSGSRLLLRRGQAGQPCGIALSLRAQIDDRTLPILEFGQDRLPSGPLLFELILKNDDALLGVAAPLFGFREQGSQPGPFGLGRREIAAEPGEAGLQAARVGAFKRQKVVQLRDLAAQLVQRVVAARNFVGEQELRQHEHGKQKT